MILFVTISISFYSLCPYMSISFFFSLPICLYLSISLFLYVYKLIFLSSYMFILFYFSLPMSQLSAGSCPFDSLKLSRLSIIPCLFSSRLLPAKIPSRLLPAGNRLSTFPWQSPSFSTRFTTCSTATTPSQLVYLPRFTALNCNYTATVNLPRFTAYSEGS